MTDIDTIIVRYGELSLKTSGVRNWYEKILVQNLKSMLDQNSISYTDITREWGRIYINTVDSNAADVAANVFGVVSTSPAVTTDDTLESVANVCVDVANELIGTNETFAIRATRTGNHDFSSQDIGVICGDAVYSSLDSLGKNPSVDLTNPDKEIFIEVRQKYAYIYTNIVKGVGGLPLGTQGKMIALISGGIDSPVAAWRMMKRGVMIVPVYFNNEPNNTKMRERAIDCIKILQKWAAGNPFKVYEVPHHDDLLTFTDYCTTKKTCLLCRRSMYLEAHEIMKKEGAKGIITGAALGQVASQTVANMYAEMYGLAIPLYHPLISFDKEEVIDIARTIGTFEISTRPVGDCFALPVRPEVKANSDSLITEEEKINIDALIEKAIKNAKIVKL